MYDIYIKYFADSSGNLVVAETKLYSIPITDPDSALTNPIVKVEMGKTGSFEFGMTPAHPYYNSLLQMKTMMRVVYDGTTIFRGRVLTIDTSPFTGERKVHLEGDLAFLMDSMQKSVDEDKRKETTVLEYLNDILKQHNEQMEDPDAIVNGTGSPTRVLGDASLSDKKFVIGEVPGTYSAAIAYDQRVNVPNSRKYGSSSWGKSSAALESLASDYGGYFRTRYDGTTCYLDWLDNSFQYAVNAQPIKLSENMIDINSSAEVDNIFTALIPIGSYDGDDLFIDGYRTDIHGNNNRILVPQIASLYSDDDLNRGYHAKSDYLNAVKDYGLIFRTQSFPNADTKEKLWSYAVDWIKENYVGGLTSFDITAIDMHHVDGSVPKYLVGDRVQVIYPDMGLYADPGTPTITKTLTIMSVQYDLHNPEKNQYSIGVPSMLLGHEYGASSKKSSSGSGGGSGRKGGGGGYNNPPPPPPDETPEERVRRLELTAYNYIANTKINKEVYDEIYESKLKEYGDTAEGRAKAEQAAGQVLQSSIHVVGRGLGAADPTSSPARRSRDAAFIRTFMFDGSAGKMTINSPIIQNPWGLSDEQMKKLNDTNRALTFDAMKQEFGLWKTINTLTPYDPSDLLHPPAIQLLNMRLGLNPTTNKTQATLKLGNDDTPADGSSFPGFIAGGDGVVEQITSYFGKGDGSDPKTNPNIEIKGPGGGSMGVGGNNSPNDFKITLNKPVSYVDKDGNRHDNVTGFVSADDFKLKNSYDSLKVRLGVFNDLIADRATIGQLTALEGKFNTLNAKAITTDNLSSGLTMSGSLHVQNGFTCDSLATVGSLMVGSRTAGWTNSFTVVTGVTLTKPSLSTTSEFTVTDSGGKSRTGKLVTGWDNGSISVTTKSLYFLGMAI